ncbi:MAG: phosphoribosyl-AMP cyclohydrolase [Nitrososphaeria archaeon]|nr:phosphoribosyl-AMP cyclohydrolase [Aigarchaeota archaeon]MCX8187962.1 phosphoribosyl-AMP cyclohydrolase [Nitrososphaeria archaeon]MDW8021602.1 phosphoribosyl-AMP cyclohydrolase [Nitrososphaerota archaeon]
MRPLKSVSMNELDFEKCGGILPVVVQEEGTGKVLTLAYVNREAIQRTLETGYAHYYRRSRGRVMMKGETSGNVQEIVDILVDCDLDAVLYVVRPRGAACHLGEETCFHNRLKEIEARSTQPP